MQSRYVQQQKVMRAGGGRGKVLSKKKRKKLANQERLLQQQHNQIANTDASLPTDAILARAAPATIATTATQHRKLSKKQRKRQRQLARDKEQAYAHNHKHRLIYTHSCTRMCPYTRMRTQALRRTGTRCSKSERRRQKKRTQKQMRKV